MREAKEILREILLKRDIVSEEDISEYLSDRPKKTYDPFLLLNMEAGVDLLLSEINAGTKICIYGDYDADGVTSVCIMYSVLRHLTDNIMYYIPSRFDEGYGLNTDAVKNIADAGAGLILEKKVGDAVKAGEVIARVFAADKQKAEQAARRLSAAYSFEQRKPPITPLIHGSVH